MVCWGFFVCLFFFTFFSGVEIYLYVCMHVCKYICMYLTNTTSVI